MTNTRQKNMEIYLTSNKVWIAEEKNTDVNLRKKLGKDSYHSHSISRLKKIFFENRFLPIHFTTSLHHKCQDRTTAQHAFSLKYREVPPRENPS